MRARRGFLVGLFWTLLLTGWAYNYGHIPMPRIFERRIEPYIKNGMAGIKFKGEGGYNDVSYVYIHAHYQGPANMAPITLTEADSLGIIDGAPDGKFDKRMVLRFMPCTGSDAAITLDGVTGFKIRNVALLLPCECIDVPMPASSWYTAAAYEVGMRATNRLRDWRVKL